jgi:hypothetical protein
MRRHSHAVLPADFKAAHALSDQRDGSDEDKQENSAANAAEYPFRYAFQGPQHPAKIPLRYAGLSESLEQALDRSAKI